jgi:glycosyltransferase involved in cell wall biosynthesis
LKIAIVHNAKFPVVAYGGTERAIWWLAKALKDLNVEVTLVCNKGSQCPFANVREADFSKPLAPLLKGFDLVHYFSTPATTPSHPYLVTIEGNGKLGETFLPNTVFVSENHATRHGAKHFVYNGVDPDDYLFQENKKEFVAFCAKASWAVKNVKGAIRMSRAAKTPLKILGGSRWWLPRFRGVSWEGMVGGQKKIETLAQAKGLLFPVIWNEPFGIAVVEAMVSGTPVLGTRLGSLPELIGKPSGKICDTEAQFIEGLRELSSFKPKECREWALSKFHYKDMAKKYLSYYEKIFRGENLHNSSPKCNCNAGEMIPLKRQSA